MNSSWLGEQEGTTAFIYGIEELLSKFVLAFVNGEVQTIKAAPNSTKIMSEWKRAILLVERKT